MTSVTQSSGLSGDKLLLFFPHQPDLQWIARTKARHPGLQVEWVASVSEDGNDIDPETGVCSDIWKGTTLLFVDWIPPPAHLFPQVRFVQLASAGADHWRDHQAYCDPNVIFSNASGSYSLQIAEWVIGAWLMHQRKFFQYQQQANAQQWSPPALPDTDDSYQARMGILGYGSIGRQCARLANALGMEVYAYTRTEQATPESRKEDGACQFGVAGTGDPDGTLPAKWFYGSSRADVDDFLRQDLDVLVISLPLTSDTEHIISSDQFAILAKKRAFVVNVARGRHINTQALVTALKTDQIRGAALDVTDPEPLLTGHPLWTAPNVFISPHVSWWTRRVWDRTLSLLEVNLHRLSLGEDVINRIK